MDNKKVFGSRAFKKGSLSIVIVVIVVCLAILLNVACKLLSNRFPLTLDLTAGKDYSMDLDQEYIDYLKGVTNKVTITVCANKLDFDSSTFVSNMIQTLSLSDSVIGSIQDTTEKYARQSGIFIENFAKFNTNFSIDYRNPSSATEFSYITGKYPDESFEYGDIIVECAHENGSERHQVIHFADYFELELNQTIYSYYYQEAYDIVGSTLASNLTSAVYVTNSENAVKLAVYTGNGCGDMSKLKNLLQRNNYDFSETSSFSSIDNDCVGVIIYAPTKDFDKNTIDALDRYLKNNGNNGRTLFFVSNSSEGQFYSLPVLGEYLAEWGINIEDGYVCEKEDKHLDNYPIYVEGTPVSCDYTNDIDSKVSYPYSLYTAMKLSDEFNSYYSGQSVLQSTDSAALLPNGASSDWTIETAEKSGPYDYICVSTLTNSNAVDSHIVAFAGDAFFGLSLLESGLYQKEYLNSEYFANAKLTLNLFNSTTGAKEQDSIEITTKTIVTSSFADALSDSPWPNIIMWVFVIAVPVILVAVGIVVFVTRKRR